MSAWGPTEADALVAGARVLTNAAGGGMPLVRTVGSAARDDDGWIVLRFEDGPSTLEVSPGAVVWASLPVAVAVGS